MIHFPDYLSEDQILRIKEDPKFVRYVERVIRSFVVESIAVTHVVWFGKRPGFISVFSKLTDHEGNVIPGAATLRGDGVGILVLLHTPGINGRPQTYTVLVEQARGPVGETIFETPAGTLDKSQDPLVIAIAEIQEEVSPALVAKPEDLKLLYEGYASPGGSDELISIVLAQFNVTEQFIADLNGSLAGADGEDEHIRVHVMPVHAAIPKLRDLKSMLAIQLAWPYIEQHELSSDPVTLHRQ